VLWALSSSGASFWDCPKVPLPNSHPADGGLPGVLLMRSLHSTLSALILQGRPVWWPHRT
jgi:hypothetical protein